MQTLDGFWDDAQYAGKIQREKSNLEVVVEEITTLKDTLEEYELVCEYVKQGDEELLSNLEELMENMRTKYSDLERKSLLSGEFDINNAILTLNAGAGGTESCDWAAMLLRMIQRWCDSKKFKVQVLDVLAGETAGVKSATVMISGPYAYGFLQSETGIHRLVRISPFDSNARRHTSFASMFVTPEIDDEIEIEVLDKDIRIDVYRSGGAGGQSVNTTDSAVRITHFPSGIVVTCQNERSQIQNKATAMKILKSRLYDLEMQKRQEKQNATEAAKQDIAWGAQIRSYVLHPYKLVKDHRTQFESGNAEKVLDGHIDDFMKAFLQWKTHGTIVSNESETSDASHD